eukprot:6404258-Ditylum_brightwellii.AAC.1
MRKSNKEKGGIRKDGYARHVPLSIISSSYASSKKTLAPATLENIALSFIIVIGPRDLKRIYLAENTVP